MEGGENERTKEEGMRGRTLVEKRYTMSFQKNLRVFEDVVIQINPNPLIKNSLVKAVARLTNKQGPC
jgi:hypothetical protein